MQRLIVALLSQQLANHGKHVRAHQLIVDLLCIQVSKAYACAADCAYQPLIALLASKFEMHMHVQQLVVDLLYRRAVQGAA